ncbi:alginate export family protein [Cellulophaga omnivescoria]|uniref:alginate export family protein n=1 Tax=Cellulophaga omnivescoria TaxID=1888890 RepID=UPI0009861C73|nr:alginate export family protein [Cellulophaga omnivescoria]WBU88236.1 alginate export family protein [Cellulophaga omnivescoria]WKB80216.1 alginate export family protein [Cellulophaga lytica]
MKLLKNVFFTTFLIIIQQVNAQQFNLDAEIKPRFEFRNGYSTLNSDAVDPASFVSQRTRLNFGYKGTEFNAFVAAQNVRVWGDAATLSTTDANGITLQQAWAEAFLGKWSFKLGRQHIAYDTERIFGRADWNQQGRSHDALKIKFKPNATNRIDIGFALNETSQSIFEEDYTLNNYKNFQYLWYNTKFNKIGLSFLFLNTGFAFDDNNEQKIAYNQTIGLTSALNDTRWSANASIYLQTGKIENSDLSALNASATINYSLNSEFLVGLGAEYMSGTDMNETTGDLNSFTPWFGTNHRYNGIMDYFYVGNHSNSVGLVDINAKINYSKNKFSVNLAPHFFSSAATIVNGNGIEQDSYLGTEIDLTFGYKASKSILFNAGYSQMFASDSMEIIKGGDASMTNNWAWAMITFKPHFFSYNGN